MIGIGRIIVSCSGDLRWHWSWVFRQPKRPVGYTTGLAVRNTAASGRITRCSVAGELTKTMWGTVCLK